MKRLSLKLNDVVYVFLLKRNGEYTYEEYTVSNILSKKKTIILSNKTNSFPLAYAYLDTVMKKSDCICPKEECIRRATKC